MENDFVLHSRPAGKPNIVAIARHIHKNHRLLFLANIKRWLVYDAPQWKPVLKPTILKVIASELQCLAEENGNETLASLPVRALTEILARIALEVTVERLPDMPADLIPCANDMLLWDNASNTFQLVQPAPEFYVTNTLTVDYTPEAQYPKFLEVIERIVPDADDRRIIQMYFGAALFPQNFTRKILVLIGEGSSGKSLLVLLLSKMLGRNRVFDLKLEQLSEKFALSSLTRDTSLLSGTEAAARTLCGKGGEWAKRLVGGDEFATSLKFRNEVETYAGRYSVIIVSNNHLRFEFETKGQEWRDRILPIFFRKSIPEAEQDRDLLTKLYAEEGSGILNWMLEGARMVRQANWQIELTDAQKMERDSLIAFSGPVKAFVAEFVKEEQGDFFLSEDAYESYNRLVRTRHLPFQSEQKFFRDLSKEMSEQYGATVTQNLRGSGGKTARGYRGFSLKPLDANE